MQTKSQKETCNGNVPPWGTANWLPWPHHHTTGKHPTETQNYKVPGKSQVPTIHKSFTIHRVFLNYYRSWMSRLAERFTPFSQILKTTEAKDKLSVITPEVMNQFRSLNNALDT